MASTRKRTTTKTGNFTKRTVTISKNGTRITNSFRPPGGATRRTHSVNLRTVQNRITHTTHLGKNWSTTRSNTKTLIHKSRSKKSSGDGDGVIVLLIVAFFAWIYELIFGKKQEKPVEKELTENQLTLMTILEQLSDSQAKILFYDTLDMWVNANTITEEQKKKIFAYDWINFDLDAWKIQNGFDD